MTASITSFVDNVLTLEKSIETPPAEVPKLKRMKNFNLQPAFWLHSFGRIATDLRLNGATAAQIVQTALDYIQSYMLTQNR